MKVLVLNCGSSSVKFQLIDTSAQCLLAKGVVEKIGFENAIFNYTSLKDAERKKKLILPLKNHETAIHMVVDHLTSGEMAVLSEVSEIEAVGHRVVHGGENFSGARLLEPEVIMALTECIELAPLHNPPNLQGIAVAKKILPQVPQVGVFDTAFHQTMPEYAFIYGIPYDLYEKYRIRRYGFHGTSHSYVSKKAAEQLGRPLGELKIITCHLGNGCSIAAVDKGRSIDTTMGFTPLEGLIMGTRCGDIDPAIITFLMKKENLSPDQINDILNKKSGFLGISGLSNDLRDVEDAMDTNQRCNLALTAAAYRIKKYIGSYTAALGGLDCLVFTGGIGEKSPIMRRLILTGMEYFGIDFDSDANEKNAASLSTGRTPVYIIPTNEELEIATETAEIVTRSRCG